MRKVLWSALVVPVLLTLLMSGSSCSKTVSVTPTSTPTAPTVSAWSQMSSSTTNLLYGVWGSSSSNVFAVGGLQAPSCTTTAAHGAP